MTKPDCIMAVRTTAAMSERKGGRPKTARAASNTGVASSALPGVLVRGGSLSKLTRNTARINPGMPASRNAARQP